jgi:hypothetical protein
MLPDGEERHGQKGDREDLVALLVVEHARLVLRLPPLGLPARGRLLLPASSHALAYASVRVIA